MASNEKNELKKELENLRKLIRLECEKERQVDKEIEEWKSMKIKQIRRLPRNWEFIPHIYEKDLQKRGFKEERYRIVKLQDKVIEKLTTYEWGEE
mgnify:CR=1 FL=1